MDAMLLPDVHQLQAHPCRQRLAAAGECAAAACSVCADADVCRLPCTSLPQVDKLTAEHSIYLTRNGRIRWGARAASIAAARSTSQLSRLLHMKSSPPCLAGPTALPPSPSALPASPAAWRA